MSESFIIMAFFKETFSAQKEGSVPAENKEQDKEMNAAAMDLLSLFARGDKEKQKIIKDYSDFLKYNKEEARGEVWQYMAEYRTNFRNAKEIRRKNSGMDDIKTARRYIKKLVDHDICPIITIPKKYLPELKKQSGITARETAIPGVKAIVGTLGRTPLVGHGKEDRVAYAVHCSPEEIDARMTGEYDYFDGVVAWKKDFIPFNKMEEINIKSMEM